MNILVTKTLKRTAENQSSEGNELGSKLSRTMLLISIWRIWMESQSNSETQQKMKWRCAPLVYMLTFVWGHQGRCHQQSLWRILRNHLDVLSWTWVQNTRWFSVNEAEIITLCRYVRIKHCSWHPSCVKVKNVSFPSKDPAASVWGRWASLWMMWHWR